MLKSHTIYACCEEYILPQEKTKFEQVPLSEDEKIIVELEKELKQKKWK